LGYMNDKTISVSKEQQNKSHIIETKLLCITTSLRNVRYTQTHAGLRTLCMGQEIKKPRRSTKEKLDRLNVYRNEARLYGLLPVSYDKMQKM
jgi:hypothetical protein